MSSSKLTLNLFGEIITIDTPSALDELKQMISEKFVFKKSDVAEFILSYRKESKKIYIESEEDYKLFLDSKIEQIQIDISNDSYIYQENVFKIKKEKENDEKKLNDLIKQNEECKKILSTKFNSQKQEIIEITKQIQELFNKRKKIIKNIKFEKGKILKIKKNNDKAIDELEKKLGLKSSRQNKIEKDMSSYKRRNNNTLYKKIIKKGNTIQNLKLSKKKNNNSYEKKNSPFKTSSEISITNGNIRNFNKNIFIRKLSPTLRHRNIGKEKKLLSSNENKSSINPFNEDKEKFESKNQKQKLVKIAEIICNTIKSANDISNDKINHKNQNIKNIDKKENKIKLKEKKELIEKNYINDELNKKKIIIKKNDVVNNLINKHQKYEKLLRNSKDKIKNSNKKNEEKKNEQKSIRNSYSNYINKKH